MVISMVTNVYAKSNYDWLRINKALGFVKFTDNNKKKRARTRSSDGDHFRVHKYLPI